MALLLSFLLYLVSFSATRPSILEAPMLQKRRASITPEDLSWINTTSLLSSVAWAEPHCLDTGAIFDLSICKSLMRKWSSQQGTWAITVPKKDPYTVVSGTSPCFVFFRNLDAPDDLKLTLLDIYLHVKEIFDTCEPSGRGGYLSAADGWQLQAGGALAEDGIVIS